MERARLRDAPALLLNRDAPNRSRWRGVCGSKDLPNSQATHVVASAWQMRHDLAIASF
jgi:hypothetical protein